MPDLKDFAPFLAFLLATTVGTLVAGVGYVLAKRSPDVLAARKAAAEKEYTDTLKGLNAALDERLGMTKEELEAQTRLVKQLRASEEKLRQRLDHLEKVIAEITLENRRLRRALVEANIPVPEPLPPLDGAT